jgi:hypothetical protein
MATLSWQPCYTASTRVAAVSAHDISTALSVHQYSAICTSVLSAPTSQHLRHDRQCTSTYTTAARSRNHRCSGNATMHSLFQKEHDFRETFTEGKICVLIMSTALAKNISHSKKTSEVTYTYRSPPEIPVVVPVKF